MRQRRRRHIEPKAAERLLLAAGWNAPDPKAYPTGGDILAQYIEPLATRTLLKDRIKIQL